IANLECPGFLSLDADWVDGVDDFDFAGFAQLADDAEGVIEAAFHREGGRAVEKRLRKLAERDAPLEKQNDAFYAGARGISGGAGGGVAGAGADDDLRAALAGLGDGERHAAVLERAGRIERLVFQVELDPGADGFGEPRRGNERRIAFEQGDDGRGAADG